jgi:predicted RecB family nuclease
MNSDLSIKAGIELGMMARRNYPEGVLIGHIENPELAVAETRRMMGEMPRPLFEAAFIHAGALVRADIMVPGGEGWRLVEVKSAGSVKDKHLIDCAIQLWVLEGAGIKVDEVCLAHVDGSFEYTGTGNYTGLVFEEDITEKVRELLADVPAWISEHQDILDKPEPLSLVGGKCDTCEFIEHCEKGMPEYPVSILPHGHKVARELQEAGIQDVRDIPAGRLKNERHLRVWQSTLTMAPYISPMLHLALDRMPYPRFYLDFETINLAIPRWAGTRPHQHVPFQWSCHIERTAGWIEHREYLEIQGASPIRGFTESLIRTLESEGAIIVYGDFEENILKQLIKSCPDLERPLRDIIVRLVDLLPMMREHYYHPDMKGSWSIKAVLPTVAPHLDYENLEDVKNGTMAQQAYLDIISPDTPVEMRFRKINNLLKYCERDTLAMVEVVRYFTGRCFPTVA